MKKLFIFLPLIFGIFFFFPSDTYALTIVNPKMEIYGYNSNGLLDLLGGCTSCNEDGVSNISGKPSWVRVYFPRNLISSFYTYSVSMSFQWSTSSSLDIWANKPVLIFNNNYAAGVTDIQWINFYDTIDGLRRIRQNNYTFTFMAEASNTLLDYYVDIPFANPTDVSYELSFVSLGIDLVTSSGSGTIDDFGVIIDNAKNDIINSNAINQHANQENFDKLLSETPPELDWVDDAAGWLPPGPVDSVLNLPFTFFSNLFSNLNKTCQPVSVPLPFVSQSLQLPCIKTIYSQLGISDFLEWIGAIAGTFILYNYFIKLYDWVDKTLELEDQNLSEWGGV